MPRISSGESARNSPAVRRNSGRQPRAAEAQVVAAPRQFAMQAGFDCKALDR